MACQENANDNHEIVYGDLSYRIKEAALAVHRYFGPGFLEKVYENALFAKLCRMGIACRQQVPLTVYFDDDGQKLVVGEYTADILVQDDIILEIKAVSVIERVHYVQVRNYLKTTHRRLGLIVNFGTPHLGFERILNSQE